MSDDVKACPECGHGKVLHRPTPTWPNRYVCDRCTRIFLPEMPTPHPAPEPRGETDGELAKAARDYAHKTYSTLLPGSRFERKRMADFIAGAWWAMTHGPADLRAAADALEPFAKYAASADEDDLCDEVSVDYHSRVCPTVADCRKAAAVMTRLRAGGGGG